MKVFIVLVVVVILVSAGILFKVEFEQRRMLAGWEAFAMTSVYLIALFGMLISLARYKVSGAKKNGSD